MHIQTLDETYTQKYVPKFNHELAIDYEQKGEEGGE